MKGIRNTWNPNGMGCEWREKCPLHGVERFLWRMRRGAKKRTGDFAFWNEAWEFIYSLEQTLFSCSSCSGHSTNPPFYGHVCEWPGCNEPADSLRNQERGGEEEWKWLDDAPQFHCHAHHMEAHYGEKYVPPTPEENRRTMAMLSAMKRMLKECPPKEVEVMGLKIQSTVMDGPYLERLFELCEEEYHKLLKVN